MKNEQGGGGVAEGSICICTFIKNKPPFSQLIVIPSLSRERKHIIFPLLSQFNHVCRRYVSSNRNTQAAATWQRQAL